jgi:hypothetical protein
LPIDQAGRSIVGRKRPFISITSPMRIFTDRLEGVNVGGWSSGFSLRRLTVVV